MMTCAAMVTFAAEPALADQQVYKDQGFSYTLEGTPAVANLTAYCYGGSTGPLVVPATLGGYPVAHMGDNAFKDQYGITNVTLPDSLITIGNQAFYDSTITSINIPRNVTSIGINVFTKCPRLVSINVDPANQHFADSSGVLYNKGLTTIILCPEGWSGPFVMPSTVVTLTNLAFWDCQLLTSVTFSNGVTSIGDDMFQDCSGLLSVSFGSGLRSIGNQSFISCTGLTTISFPASLQSIGASAFNGCWGLNTISFPASLQSIGRSAFGGCSGVASITIPDGVTEIDASAFSSCLSLQSVHLGKALASFDPSAFNFCSALTSISVDPANQHFADSSGVLCDKGLTTIIIYPLAKSGPFVMPSTVVTLYGSVFSNCAQLTSISISNGVTSIGDNMFMGCSGLRSVSFGTGLKAIGNQSFLSCGGLTTISLPNGLLSIGHSAFNNCWGLTGITLPDSLTYLDTSVFSGCTALQSVHIGNGLSYIGDGSFSDCTALTSISFGTGVTAIGSTAFSGCTALTQVTVPNWVQTISAGAFNSCSKLTYVTIGQGVTSIGAGAFAATNLGAITIPDSVTSIGNSAFCQSWGLQSVSLGTGLMALGDYAFSETGLLSIVIPDNVTYIGQYCFQNCPAMTSATLGSSVDTIEWRSFTSIPGLANIYFRGLTTPWVNSDSNSPWTQFSGYPNGPTGHAYAASNFPTPGNAFYGLNMGSYLTTSPLRPTNATALPGNAEAFLNWTPPTFNGGAPVTGYKIYWAVLGQAYAYHTTVTSTSYAATGLSNGQTYVFRITAVNSVGEGPVSLTLTVKAGLPQAPQALASAYGTNMVTLAWTAPTSTGLTLQGYVVYRSSSASGAYYQIATPSTTAFVDTDLAPGQTYWYKVSAQNSFGEGTTCAPVSAAGTVAGQPMGLNATAGDGAVQLSWSAPSGSAWTAGDYYVIYQNNVSLPNYFTVASATISGLTNGQQYSFSVAMHNVWGIGAKSATVTTIPYTAPDAPASITATPGNCLVNLVWTAPTSGGMPIDYYVVYQDGVALASHFATNSANVTGLANGRHYAFTVAAHNAAGLGTQSSAIIATPFTAPDAPTWLGAVQVSIYVLNLTWAAPAFDGGAVVDYYQISQDGRVLMGTFTGNFALIGGVLPGISSSFVILAHNAAGFGAQSAVLQAMTVNVPGAPGNLTATVNGTNITLVWSAPTYDGGAAIIQYGIYRGTSAGGEGSTAILSVNSTTLQATDTSAVTGTTYYYVVRAINSQGSGSASGEISAALMAPGAPTSLTVVSSPGHIGLTWTAPVDSGSSAVLYYQIFRGGSSGAEGSVPFDVASGTYYNDTSVSAGQTYYYI
ncbi:MAG: fibronectin type III domain-containing protein, partial [Methanomassiliicoccales archaeon]